MKKLLYAPSMDMYILNLYGGKKEEHDVKHGCR